MPSSGAPLPRDGSVAVVGASLSGLRACETLRSEGFTGQLHLIGDEFHLPYDRPPLSKQVLAGTWPPERASLADNRRLGELGVVLHLGQRATSLDAEAMTVVLEDGTALATDAVVVATGARPRQLPGTEGLDGVRLLRTLDDSLELRRRVLAAGEGGRVVVVGAGFIGSEVASTCAGLGSTVTVLEALGTPLENALGPTVGAACGALHERNGVTLRTGTGVSSVHAGDGVLSVDLSDGSAIGADVVVVGIGVAPETGWLEGSGLTVGNGVECDHALFAADRVVACGDLARWRWDRAGDGASVRIEHWQLAAEMGVAAARSLMAGRAEATPFDPLPYFWSDQYGTRIQSLGYPRPTDDVELVQGSYEEGKFLVCYGRDGQLSAALAVGMARQLMGLRPLLEAGATFDEGLAVGRP